MNSILLLQKVQLGILLAGKVPYTCSDDFHLCHEFLLRWSSLMDDSSSPELHDAGYALSSVEGRVAMEFFDPSEASQAKKYGSFSSIPCSIVQI
jgi:hypothetical protein